MKRISRRINHWRQLLNNVSKQYAGQRKSKAHPSNCFFSLSRSNLKKHNKKFCRNFNRINLANTCPDKTIRTIAFMAFNRMSFGAEWRGVGVLFKSFEGKLGWKVIKFLTFLGVMMVAISKGCWGYIKDLRLKF